MVVRLMYHLSKSLTYCKRLPGRRWPFGQEQQRTTCCSVKAIWDDATVLVRW